MMATPRKSASSVPTNLRSQATDIETRIRQRAYEIYEITGRIDGRDLDHWLQAEAEILGHRAEKAAA
jgi:hypothetical protein